MSRLAWIQILGTAFVLAVSMVEALVLHRRAPGRFDWSETWLSVADLAGRRVVQVLPLNIAAPVFAWAWQHRIATMPLHGAASFLLLFVGLEFCYYWYHRAAHRIRFFWATHVVHHSPNQLSLSTSFRLGWTGKLTGTTVFFTPLVWLGFQPQVVLSALAFNLLYQFWLHTTWIPKLGWLEYVFNTPSAHRVHHASNERYLDANFGGVLIVFDRLFGTYVEERAEEPCIYGVVHPIRTHNLLALEAWEWRALGRDLRGARSLGEAVGYVLRPPGWTPARTREDVSPRFSGT
jgi:sterol desaturase/sphingolipid hydroxylase (fatty acid hydroxylase superfamily)